MIRQYRERRSGNFNELKIEPQVPLEISALEWNGKRPYSSLNILVNWAGHLANSCYLDGLERGESATGILVFRRGDIDGLTSVHDGDFITKHPGGLYRHDRRNFLERYELLPELTNEERATL